MTKTKILSFYPGDNIDVHITAQFTCFTILKIEAIEIKDPVTDTIKINLNE